MVTSYIEIIGYAGSALIAVSLMMSNILKLRIINAVGASLFTFYGVLLGAIPIIFLNGLIVLIDVYFLWNMLGSKENFELIYIQDKQAAWPNQFLNYYQKDIKTYFSRFDLNRIEQPNIVMIRRNMMAVGMFVYEILENDDLFVHLDYVVPDYRDFKSARFLYAKGKDLCIAGDCRRYVTWSDNSKHHSYLKKLGFTPVLNKENEFVRAI